MSAIEPTVTPAADKLLVACPECGSFGTHTGICSWSFARRGEIWTFYAERISLPTLGRTPSAAQTLEDPTRAVSPERTDAYTGPYGTPGAAQTPEDPTPAERAEAYSNG